MCEVRRCPSKEEWLREAERDYEKLFVKDEGNKPLTFREIEAQAVEAGDKLSRWLLEKKLPNDSAGLGPG